MRRLAGLTGLSLLAALVLAAAPASATEANLNVSEGFPSEVEIDDPDGDRDLITVTVSGANVVITDTGPGGITPDGTECAVVSPTQVTCPLDPPDDPPPADPFFPVDNIDYDGEEGNDEITINAQLGGNDLEAGPGDDIINGGPLDDDLEGEEGNDQVNGNGGDDSVEGMDGNDLLNGGEGDDSLDDGGGGSLTGGTDVLTGGPGTDFSDYFRDLAVNISLDKVANDGFPGENDNVDVEDLDGGEGDDVLTGNGERNELFGDDGNDTILGLGGEDRVDGDSDDDTLDGGPAADEVICSDGLDTALLDIEDTFGPDCERTGADAKRDTVTFNRKGKAKVPVSCPAVEVADCTGKATIVLNGKTIAKGKFKAAPGKTKKAKLKLSKSGKKSLKRSGGKALAQLQVATDLAGGTSAKTDSVLVAQKAGGKRRKGKVK